MLVFTYTLHVSSLSKFHIYFFTNLWHRLIIAVVVALYNKVSSAIVNTLSN